MALQQIDALIMRRCGKSDIRAILGKGGGHQVVVVGAPELWVETFGLKVRPQGAGGTTVPIEPEPGGAAGFDLHMYYTEGYRDEVRASVTNMLAANSQIVKAAKAVRAKIDPDKGGNEENWVACIIRTVDGRFHLRGLLWSQVPQPLQRDQKTFGVTMTQGVTLDPEEAKVWTALMRYRSVLLFGPPGTGKTRLMLRIRQAFEKGMPQVAFNTSDSKDPFKTSSVAMNLPKKRAVGFTTFHQSLTYENFVVGLRPVALNGKLAIQARDGLFLELAAHALRDDSASLLLIDELNRGNAADIFGELITVVEPDKRLDPANKATEQTVTVRLPVDPENQQKSPRLTRDFQMPHYFYLLASMNSLDRSVAPLDSAMRRRFRVIHLAPRPEVARERLLGDLEAVTAVTDLKSPTIQEVGSIALEAWQYLNRAIARHWGPEFLLGHSYVLEIRDVPTLISAFNEAILPQLWELYRDRPTDLSDVLRLDEGDEADVLALRTEEEGEIQLGLSQGAPVQPMNLSAMSVEDAVRRLFFLAFGKPATHTVPPAPTVPPPSQP